jgi:hypothetical protein
MVVWPEIETLVIGKGGIKRGGGVMREGSGIRTAGFCGPCVCLGIFPPLYWRVLVSGAGGVYGWNSRLVSEG